MTKLKVYWGLLFKDGKQWKVVVAVNSQTELSHLAHVSLYQIRNYWGLSYNRKAKQKALTNPHEIVWYEPLR